MKNSRFTNSMEFNNSLKGKFHKCLGQMTFFLSLSTHRKCHIDSLSYYVILYSTLAFILQLNFLCQQVSQAVGIKRNRIINAFLSGTEFQIHE